MEQKVQTANGSYFKKSNRSIYLAVMLFSFLLLSAVFYIKPPFGSPDEATHLFRANSLAQGYVLLEPIGKDGTTGGEVNGSLGKAVLKYGDYVNTHSYRGSDNFVEELKSLKWDSNNAEIGLPTTAFYMPFVYVPQAVSFYIGEKLNLSVYSTYALINYLTFGVCILIFLAAYRIYPIPLFSLCLILLPMSVYQIFSPTIDGISLALTCLGMSFFMALLNSEKDNTGKNWRYILAGLALCIIIVIGSRANLICMVLIPLWLFFISRKKTYLAAFLIVSVITLGWIGYSITSSYDPSSVKHGGLSNAQLIAYYVKNPLVILNIAINTFTNGDKLVFYYNSLIGNLAWLDAPIHKTIRNLFAAILVASLLAHLIAGKLKTSRATAFLIAILAVVSLALIFAALLVQWSTFPTEEIDGVQGRYFIIPLVILGYALPQLRFTKKTTALILASLSVVSVATIYVTLNERYHTTIDIPQERDVKRDGVIYNLDGENHLQFGINTPDGKIKTVNVLMANYRRTAKGIVSLRVCSEGNCVDASSDISNRPDNAYYRFKFNKPLEINNGAITMDFSFKKRDNSSPAALWLFEQKDDETVRIPKMQFKYSSIK
ncbi:DUF2142 domain-containing protein [Erwinia sp. BC051422]|uniref:DUF2142 domain-containing protein n=1 Tax=Erwinia wuhanensis TaxID=3045167 RepID=UPI00264DB87C|nr:DUF2142 domain-containing protein [Erwinia sp. BC051422]MDN8542450.1 DUF2142 domain-containing protein [Erwinia sp. BC051422]